MECNYDLTYNPPIIFPNIYSINLKTLIHKKPAYVDQIISILAFSQRRETKSIFHTAQIKLSCQLSLNILPRIKQMVLMFPQSFSAGLSPC